MSVTDRLWFPKCRWHFTYQCSGHSILGPTLKSDLSPQDVPRTNCHLMLPELHEVTSYHSNGPLAAVTTLPKSKIFRGVADRLSFYLLTSYRPKRINTEELPSDLNHCRLAPS